MLANKKYFYMIATISILSVCASSCANKTDSSATSTDTTNTQPLLYSIGGTVSGLVGTLVLQNNGGDNKTLTSVGSFTFDTSLASAASYNISIFTQPSGQSCTITAGSGTVTNANVSDVDVNCSSNQTGLTACTWTSSIWGECVWGS